MRTPPRLPSGIAARRRPRAGLGFRVRVRVRVRVCFDLSEKRENETAKYFDYIRPL